jgi:hypothetical protein
MESIVAIPHFFLLELLRLVLCTSSKVLKWVPLLDLDLHRFGLLIFQIEYSLVLDMWFDRSSIDSFMMVPPFIQAYRLQ